MLTKRAKKLEKAISMLMQEMIKADDPRLGITAIAFQTIRRDPATLDKLMKCLEKV